MTLIDQAIREKAKRLGHAKICNCREPDVEWVDEKDDWNWDYCRTCHGAVIGLDHEEYVAIYTSRGWAREECGCYAGIMWGGDEPRDCRSCNGSGQVWRSPKGRYALYPGGPFCG